MAQRYCDHNFVPIRQVISANIGIAIIGCYYCGQIRHLREDGIIEIVKEQGEVKKYAAGEIR